MLLADFIETPSQNCTPENSMVGVGQVISATRREIKNEFR